MAVDRAGRLRVQRGYNSAEVEGIIFGLVPEWLTRETARAFSGSDAMNKRSFRQRTILVTLEEIQRGGGFR